jgi:siroheme synthase (precorrin-2 oxidase/ferrochelatase)
MTLAHNLPKFESVGKLHKKTIVITGGSRGIGLEMAKRFARDGCNIIILAKTVTPHPKLPGIRTNPKNFFFEFEAFNLNHYA